MTFDILILWNLLVSFLTSVPFLVCNTSVCCWCHGLEIRSHIWVRVYSWKMLFSLIIASDSYFYTLKGRSMFSGGGGLVLWATYLLTYFSCVFKVLCFFKHQSLHPRPHFVSLSLFSLLSPLPNFASLEGVEMWRWNEMTPEEKASGEMFLSSYQFSLFLWNFNSASVMLLSAKFEISGS